MFVHVNMQTSHLTVLTLRIFDSSQPLHSLFVLLNLHFSHLCMIFFCRKKYHLFEEKFTTFGETVVIWCQRDFNQIKRYSVHLSVCLFCEYLFLRCINLSSICFFARLQIYFLLPLSWLNYSTVDSYLLIPSEPLSLNLNKSSLMFISN